MPPAPLVIAFCIRLEYDVALSPAPDWIEPGEGRVSYLWTCHACNYRFEAVAIFGEVAAEHPPLAA